MLLKHMVHLPLAKQLLLFRCQFCKCLPLLPPSLQDLLPLLRLTHRRLLRLLRLLLLLLLLLHSLSVLYLCFSLRHYLLLTFRR